MRALVAPFFYIGRILLWIFILPIGIWRSLVHHRKKGHRKTMKAMKRELKEE
jgi:hypothetical protein